MRELKSGDFLCSRYKIIDRLSEGSFGRTYIAQDSQRPSHPMCVVKQLMPGNDNSHPRVIETARRLFDTEAEILELLGNHSQIPQLLAHFSEEGEFFVIQELIDGDSLTVELNPGKTWPERKIIETLQDVLQILVFIHDKGVIHRDIKPDNIIRRLSDQRLVLVDFGSVKQVGGKLTYSSQGHIAETVAIGTPGYMPTEQTRGKPHPNSDIYALGIIGIQAATGLNLNQLIEDPQTDELVWQPWARMGDSLIMILEKMTKYNFRDRYQSAREVLGDLAELQEPLFLVPDDFNALTGIDLNSPNSPDKLDEPQPFEEVTGFSEPKPPPQSTLFSPPLDLNSDSPSSRPVPMFTSKGIPPIFFILAALLLAGSGHMLWRSRDTLTQLLPSSGDSSEPVKQPGPNTIPTTEEDVNQPDVDTRPTTEAENFRLVEGVPAGLFSYGGSTTWAPIRGKIDPILQGEWPEFKLLYTDPITGNPGSGTGIKMLLDNQLAFAHSSRSLKPEEYREAQQRGFTLEEVPVAIDALAIAVHPSQTAPGLTIDQIRGIYQGTITNWQQVGGPNLSITPYSRQLQAGGTVQFFVENVLGEERLSPAVKLIPDTTQALRAVARDPGGIYYASVPELVPQCTVKPLPIGRQAGEFVPPYAEPYVPPSDCPNQRNLPNAEAFSSGDYPITRRLFVIVKRNGQSDELAGDAYARLMLTNQAQDLIEELGFVRIR